MAWTPDIRTKRHIYDGLWVYDHEGILLGKVVRYNDNYRLWQIAFFNQDERIFERPSGWYNSQKDALNEFRSMYNYPEVA